MEKSINQANFQLIDNYISDFSLKVSRKIKNESELTINGSIGFGIININENDMIGQIEFRQILTIQDGNEEVANISISMNALFKGSNKLKINEFEEMLKINGATTLSHLCRAYILSTTAQSGMQPITTPLINFQDFFETATQENLDEIKSK